VVGSLDQAFANSGTEPETWVIGGAQIYSLALPHATRCEVTEVDIDLPRDDDDALAPCSTRHGWARRGVAGEPHRASVPVSQLPPLMSAAQS